MGSLSHDHRREPLAHALRCSCDQSTEIPQLLHCAARGASDHDPDPPRDYIQRPNALARRCRCRRLAGRVPAVLQSWRRAGRVYAGTHVADRTFNARHRCRMGNDMRQSRLAARPRVRVFDRGGDDRGFG